MVRAVVRPGAGAFKEQNDAIWHEPWNHEHYVFFEFADCNAKAFSPTTLPFGDLSNRIVKDWLSHNARGTFGRHFVLLSWFSYNWRGEKSKYLALKAEFSIPLHINSSHPLWIGEIRFTELTWFPAGTALFRSVN